jgi:hypothetical protein
MSTRARLPAALVRRSFAQQGTTTFFPHFVGDASTREPHQLGAPIIAVVATTVALAAHVTTAAVPARAYAVSRHSLLEGALREQAIVEGAELGGTST